MKRHSRTTVLGALVLGGLIVMIGAGSAQQQGQAQGQGQGQGRGQGAGRGGGNFSNNFTGKIEVKESSEMRMSRIRFEAGARTNWHLHSSGQVLLIEEGRGRWQEVGKEIRDIPMNQPVYTTPNVLHWHGAAPDQHALQFSVYSGSLDWKEPVSDAEYTGKTKR